MGKRYVFSPLRRWKGKDISMWIYSAVLMLFMLMTFTYIDIQSNTVWSTNLLDLVVEGRVGYIYQYAIENIHNAPHGVMGGNILSMIPFAIWNLPIWAAQRFGGIEVMDSALSMFWAKLFLVFCLAITLIMANKIMKLMNMSESQRNTAMLLSASSLMTYTAIGYAGGFDIVSISVFVSAVYCLLINKKPAFLILAGIAIAFKPFCAIGVVGVLLYKQKNILKIALDLVILMLPTVIINALFINAPGYAESTAALNDSTMEQIFTPSLSAGVAHVSYVVLFLIVLYVYCYFIKESDDKVDSCYHVIYIITAAYGCLFLWAHTGFYRGLMLMPFLYILIAKKAEYFKLSVILEMFMQGGWIARISTFSGYIFSPKYIAQSLLPFFTRSADEFKISNTYDLWRTETLSKYLTLASPICGAVFFAGLLILLVMLHPNFKVQAQHSMEKCESWILWLRLLVPLFVSLIPILLYFY